MGNPIKRKYDKISVIKDIIEREDIVRQFQTTGFLDRNDAIEKITSLQFTDSDIAIATVAKQAQFGSVDLYWVGNNTIIANMLFQIDFLKAKLAKLEAEEKVNG